MKFINHARDGTEEVAVDNEPILVAGVAFRKSARAKTGYTTVATPNKMHDKRRTGVAESFVQTIRGLQKTLVCHIEAEIKATIPSRHMVAQWAAMNGSWLYHGNNAYSTLKVVPYQNLCGRSYQGKVVSFGQTLFCLCPTTRAEIQTCLEMRCMVGQGHC